MSSYTFKHMDQEEEAPVTSRYTFTNMDQDDPPQPQAAQPDPLGPPVPDPIQQLQGIPAIQQPQAAQGQAGTFGAPLLSTDVPGQPVPSPLPANAETIIPGGVWEVFRNFLPHLARRVQDLNDDKSLILEPWKKAIENIRERPEQPIGSRGLDWAGAGHFLGQGLKALVGTVGENVGPIFDDVNLVDRVLGPAVEAVAQTPEHTLDEGVVSEFWKTLKKTPEIAERWWEIFKANQRGEANSSLVRDAAMAFVDKGLIKPEHTALLTALFSVVSNPVIMHSLLFKTAPGVGRALERTGARVKESFGVRSLQKSTTLTGEMPGVNRPMLNENGKTMWNKFVKRPSIVRAHTPTAAETAARQTLDTASKSIPPVTMPARPAFVEAGQPTFAKGLPGMPGPGAVVAGLEIVDAVAAGGAVIGGIPPGVPDAAEVVADAAVEQQVPGAEAAQEPTAPVEGQVPITTPAETPTAPPVAPEAATEAPEQTPAPQAPAVPVEAKAPTALSRIAGDVTAHVKALDEAVVNETALPSPKTYPDDERADAVPAFYAKVTTDDQGFTATPIDADEGVIRNPAIAAIVKETNGRVLITPRGLSGGEVHDRAYVVDDENVLAVFHRAPGGWRADTAFDVNQPQPIELASTATQRDTDDDMIAAREADLWAKEQGDLDDQITHMYGGVVPLDKLWDAKTNLARWIFGLPGIGRALHTESDIANRTIGALLGDVYGILNEYSHRAVRANEYWTGIPSRLRTYLSHPSLLGNKLSNIWKGTPPGDLRRMEVYRGIEDEDAKDLSAWQIEEGKKLGNRLNHYWKVAEEAGLVDSGWFRDNYFSHIITGWSTEKGGPPLPAKDYGKFLPGWKKKQFFQHKRTLTGTIEELETNGVAHETPNGTSVTLFPTFIKDPAIIEPLYLTALGRGIALQGVMTGLYGLPTGTGYNGIVNKDTLDAMPEEASDLYRPLDLRGMDKWRVLGIENVEGPSGDLRVVKMAEQDLHILTELYEPLAKLAGVPLEDPLGFAGKAWGLGALVAKRMTLLLSPFFFATLGGYALVAPSGWFPKLSQVLKTMNEFGAKWGEDDPELLAGIRQGLTAPQLGQAELEIRQNMNAVGGAKRPKGVLAKAFRSFTETWIGDTLSKVYKTLHLPIDAWDFILFDRMLGAATYTNYKFALQFYRDEKKYDELTATRMAVEEASTFMGALQKIMTTRKGDYVAVRAFLASLFRRANMDTYVKALTGKGYGWKFRPVQGGGGSGTGDPKSQAKLENQVARRAAAKILKGIIWATSVATVGTLTHYMNRWRREGKRPPTSELTRALDHNVKSGGNYIYTTRTDRAGRLLRTTNPTFRPFTEGLRTWNDPWKTWSSQTQPFTRTAGEHISHMMGWAEIWDSKLPFKRKAKELTKHWLRGTTFYSRLPYETGGSVIPRSPREHFMIWAGVYPSKIHPNVEDVATTTMETLAAVLQADRADARVRAWDKWLRGEDTKSMRLLLSQYGSRRATAIFKSFGPLSRTWARYENLPADKRAAWFDALPPDVQDAFFGNIAEESFTHAQQEELVRKKR